MVPFLFLLALVVCFLCLGRAADLLVFHIRRIGERLGIGVFFLGLLLGLFTSFPELALGVSAYANNEPALSIGNLLGGIAVLLGLVLGTSIVLNRQIQTKANGNILFLLAYLLLPLLLGLDGVLGIIDGLVLALSYLLLVYALYAWHRTENGTFVRFIPRQVVVKDLFLTLFGILAVLIISNIIVRITVPLLGYFHVPAFLVGLLVFALGTNLPELVITIRSWRSHAGELSVSHLLGSAIVNPFLIGIFAFLRPTSLTVGLEYHALLISFVTLFACVYLFSRSGDRFVRNEGIALIGCYLVFLVSQIGTVAVAGL